jgi:hypothetical protein
VEVEALYADQTPVAELTVPQIRDHLGSGVRAIDAADHHVALRRRRVHAAAAGRQDTT